MRRTRSSRGVRSTWPKPSERSGRGRAPTTQLSRAGVGTGVVLRVGREAGAVDGAVGRCRGGGRALRGPGHLRRVGARAAGQKQAGQQQCGGAGQSSRRSLAHRVSSWREDSWSLRSTLDTCVSTVLMEMNSVDATSL